MNRPIFFKVRKYSPISSARRYSLIFLLTCLVTLWAGSGPWAAQTLILTPGQGRYELGPYLEILEDKDRKWNLVDVTSPPISQQFEPIKSRTLSLGLSSSAFWIRFSVKEAKRTFLPLTEDRRWLLDIGRPFIKHISFFAPLPDGNQETASSEHSLLEPIAFQLPYTPGHSFKLHLRVEHDSALILPLTIFSNKAFLKASWKKLFWLGIYYGIILSMVLFNIFVFISLRNRNYLFYVLYAGSTALYFSSFEYLLPISPILIRKLTIIFLGSLIFWGIIFARSSLITKKYAPWNDKVLLMIMVFALGLVGMVPFVERLLLNQIASILGMISPMAIIVAGVICLRRGFRPARFFLIAWSILTVSGLIFALTYRGVLPYSVATFHSFKIGSGIEVVLLSFALGDRLRILRRERERVMEIFGRYVTREIRDEVMSGRIPLDGEIKEVTVLFADLRDFATLVNRTEPKEAITIINRYFNAMAQAIRQNRGLVLQYIGDEIEAVFGAPLSLANHPSHAVKASLEMRQQLSLVNSELQQQGYEPLRHGIGIHTGSVIAANIGSPDRLSYSLVGDTINLASRIQDLNKKFGTDILVSATTQAFLEDDFAMERAGEATVKGISDPVEIFRLI